MTRRNVREFTIALGIWILAVTATLLLMLLSRGHFPDLAASGGFIIFVCSVMALPGPLLVGMLLHVNMYSPHWIFWPSIFVGLCLDLLLYWLMVHFIGSTILFFRRRDSGTRS